MFTIGPNMGLGVESLRAKSVPADRAESLKGVQMRMEEGSECTDTSLAGSEES